MLIINTVIGTKIISTAIRFLMVIVMYIVHGRVTNIPVYNYGMVGIIIVKRIIAESGASSIKEMGKVMGLANKELAGKADGKLIGEIVKSQLG